MGRGGVEYRSEMSGKASLAGSLDAVVCLCVVEAERESIIAGAG